MMKPLKDMKRHSLPTITVNRLELLNAASAIEEDNALNYLNLNTPRRSVGDLLDAAIVASALANGNTQSSNHRRQSSALFRYYTDLEMTLNDNFSLRRSSSGKVTSTE